MLKATRGSLLQVGNPPTRGLKAFKSKQDGNVISFLREHFSVNVGSSHGHFLSHLRRMSSSLTCWSLFACLTLKLKHCTFSKSLRVAQLPLRHSALTFTMH